MNQVVEYANLLKCYNCRFHPDHTCFLPWKRWLKVPHNGTLSRSLCFTANRPAKDWWNSGLLMTSNPDGSFSVWVDVDVTRNGRGAGGGGVLIASCYPKFNGSHFGLPPSSIHENNDWTGWQNGVRKDPILQEPRTKMEPPTYLIGRITHKLLCTIAPDRWHRQYPLDFVVMPKSACSSDLLFGHFVEVLQRAREDQLGRKSFSVVGGLNRHVSMDTLKDEEKGKNSILLERTEIKRSDRWSGVNVLPGWHETQGVYTETCDERRVIRCSSDLFSHMRVTLFVHQTVRSNTQKYRRSLFFF